MTRPPGISWPRFTWSLPFVGSIDDRPYVHECTVGDLLVWDHIGTWHFARPDYGPDEPRLMKRCQVMATKIFDPAFVRDVLPERAAAFG